jgi:hypothetical protein
MTSMKILTIGSQEVRLVPIGKVIIGARGRIDLEGRRGTKKLLLVDKASKGPTIKVTVRGETDRQEDSEALEETGLVWKFLNPPPSIHYVEFTPETLMDAIVEVADA